MTGVALVLDAMFAPRIAGQLRDRGHDVVALVADPVLAILADDEVLAWAVDHRRRVVTENVKDFRQLMRSSPAGAQVLYTSSRTFPRQGRGAQRLVDALARWLSQPDVHIRPEEDWLPGLVADGR